MKYYFAYDIANQKRRYRIAKMLENYGLRVQYSFFECEMENEMLSVLREQILNQMDLDEDSLAVYPVCEDCQHRTVKMGKGNINFPQNYTIL